MTAEIELNRCVKRHCIFVSTGYDLTPASLSGEQKTLFYHRYVEALKFANGLKKHTRDLEVSSELSSCLKLVTICKEVIFMS